tara:strand:+ start:272 stop:424 length:153 start_codon:yes stop_codon:yes gene_type:complete
MLGLVEHGYSIELFDLFWYRYTQVMFTGISIIYTVIAVSTYRDYLKECKI